MTVTYSETNDASPLSTEVAFVPSYARGSRKKKSVKTWMILAPLGALALVGGGAALMMADGPTTQPLVEEPVAAVATPLPASAAPVESSTLPSNVSIEATPVQPLAAPAPAAVAPGVRTRQPTPVARERTVPIVREQAPAEPTGVRPYAPAATAAPAATPPAPAIAVAPLS